jgi:aspartyl protease family protein
MRLNDYCRVFAALAALAFSCALRAADVNVVGLFAGKALVEIDRAAPKLMSVGQRVGGVKLLSADSQQAVFEIDGKRATLRMGQSISGGAPKSSAKPMLTLSASSGGHFVADGTINGASTRFLVDTGATSVAMSSDEARRLGVRYLQGEPTFVGTANGTARAYRLKLDSVRIGDIKLHHVDAAVVEGSSPPIVLLGMSFLNRMEMKRSGSTLTLIQQY